MTDISKRDTSQLETLAGEINAEHRAFVGSLKKTAEHGIRCGELLSEVKAQCKHGTWLHWLERNFEGSERSAQIYLKLYNRRDAIRANTQNPADLSIDGALKAIAAPQTDTLDRPAGMPEDEFKIFLQAHEDGLEYSCAVMLDPERIARLPENKRRGWVSQAAWESMVEQGRRYAETLPDPDYPELHSLTPEYLTEVHTQAEKLRWWVRQVEWLESLVRACDWPPGGGMPPAAFIPFCKEQTLSNLYHDDKHGNGLRSPCGHLREWLGDVV